MKKILFFLFLGTLFIARSEGLKTSYEEALFVLGNRSLDSAKIVAYDFLNQCKRQDDSFYLVKAYFLNAYIAAEMEQFGSAVIYYLEGARFAEPQKEPKIQKNLISIYKNLALILGDYNHYSLSHKFIDKALKIAKSSGNLDQEIELLENRVHELVDEKRYSEAINEIELLLNSYDNEKVNIISLKNKLGIIHNELGAFEKAKENYEYILENASTENVFYPLALHNIGEIFLKQKEWSNARKYFQLAITSKRELNKDKEQIGSLCGLAESYTLSGEPQKALKYLLEAALVDENSKSSENPDTHYLYKLLSQTFETLGNNQRALEYKTIYTQKLEEFIAKQKEIEELDKKYNIQLLTERYFDLLAANEEKRQAERLAQFGVGGTTAFFLIVLAFIYFRQHHVRSSIQREIKEIESISKV